MTDTAGTFYLLVCRECGNGDLVMPFGSPAERGKWAAGHTTGTGHDRWFVTEADRRLSGQEVAGMLARHDEVRTRRAGGGNLLGQVHARTCPPPRQGNPRACRRRPRRAPRLHPG